MRSYTVIGMGAIGGYYGARLADAGADVRFVVRHDLERLRADGLRVDSPRGDLHVPVDAFADPAQVPPSDVIVVATKTTATDSVAPVVAELVGSWSAGSAAPAIAPIVVVMQNGLGVEAPFAAAAPDSPVVGAMCFMCSNLVAPGHVVHLDHGAVTLGEHRPDGSAAGLTPAVEVVLADLEAARVEATLVPDLVTGRWRKLVWNIPFNGLSVVLDAGTDEMLADPATRARARALMDEVVAAAEACGHGFDPAFADRMMATTETMTPYKTSMKLDHEAGRPLELDAIYAAPTAAARAAGAPMIGTEALLAQLRAMDPAGSAGSQESDSPSGDAFRARPPGGTSPATAV